MLGHRRVIAALAALLACFPAGCSAESPSPSALFPTLRPTVVAPSHGPWLQLGSAVKPDVVWSPDGQWLLVSSGVTNGTADQQVVSLHDRSGRLIRTMQGVRPFWVDSRAFIVLTGPAYEGEPTGRDAVEGTVDSATLTPIGVDMAVGVVPNGHGAVAYELSPPADAKSSFAVWTADGTSASTPGVPVAWSADGQHLAVWHWTHGPSGPTVSGWVEVVSWPGLRREIKVSGVATGPFRGAAQFNPAGSDVYVRGSVGFTAALVIVDLATGAVGHVSPTFDYDTPAWNNADQLVIPSLEGGNAAVFDIHGQQVGTVHATGDSIIASADGSLLVSWMNSDPAPVTPIRGSTAQAPIAVSGPVFSIIPAPDGSTFVALWAGDAGREAFLLQP